MTKSQPEPMIPSEISDQHLGLILDALLSRNAGRNRELLAMILRAWFNERLPSLRRYSENVKEAAARRKEAKKISTDLTQILKRLDDEELKAEIVAALAEKWGVIRWKVWRELPVKLEFLRDLAEAGKKNSRGRRGRQRNQIATQAILDLAEIFKYATGTPATRTVDRLDGHEHGHFREFCGAVWPVAFAKGDDGLPAALRKYQDLKRPAKGYDFNETFLERLHRLHPEWGIFEDPEVE